MPSRGHVVQEETGQGVKPTPGKVADEADLFREVLPSQEVDISDINEIQTDLMGSSESDLMGSSEPDLMGSSEPDLMASNEPDLMGSNEPDLTRPGRRF